MAAFSDADKARIRYHLGYPNVDSTLQSYGGVMFAGQAQFSLDYAMNNVMNTSVALITKNLDILDQIETQMVAALERLQAAKADVVTLNPTEHADLQGQYAYWQNRLSMQLSVPVNPYKPNNGASGLNMRRVSS